MSVQCSPGQYKATIADHKLAEAKTGNLQLAFTIAVLGKVNPEDPEQLFDDGAGLTRTVIRTITENTAARIYQELDHLGYTGDGFSALDPDLAGTKFVNLAGQEVLVRMRVEEYEGADRERWEFDFLGGGMNLKPAEASKAKQIDGQFSRSRVGVAPKPKSPSCPAANANGKSKIPF